MMRWTKEGKEHPPRWWNRESPLASEDVTLSLWLSFFTCFRPNLRQVINKNSGSGNFWLFIPRICLTCKLTWSYKRYDDSNTNCLLYDSPCLAQYTMHSSVALHVCKSICPPDLMLAALLSLCKHFFQDFHFSNHFTNQRGNATDDIRFQTRPRVNCWKTGPMTLCRPSLSEAQKDSYIGKDRKLRSLDLDSAALYFVTLLPLCFVFALLQRRPVELM